MDTEEIVEESLSLEDKEIELIMKALENTTEKENMQPRTWGSQNEPFTGKSKSTTLNSNGRMRMNIRRSILVAVDHSSC